MKDKKKTKEIGLHKRLGNCGGAEIAGWTDDCEREVVMRKIKL